MSGFELVCLFTIAVLCQIAAIILAAELFVWLFDLLMGNKEKKK